MSERLTAAAERDLTTYYERARTVQEERGGVSVASCISREDLETLERAAVIVTFARTLATMIGMRREDAAMLDATIAGLGAAVAEMDDPAENWKGSPEERAAASRERERIYDAGMDHGEEDGFREGYRAALAELIDHMTIEPGCVHVYSPDDIRRYAAGRGVTLGGDTDGE